MTKHPHYTTSDTWGKLNLGQRYGILATDLDRALALVGLNKYEAILVQAIRERCWGTSAMRKRRGEPWPESEPCELNISQLAREVNPAKFASTLRLLRRAKVTLLDKRIVTAVGTRLTVNKDVEEWPIDPDEIGYAVAAQTRANGDQGGDQSVTPPVTNQSPGGVTNRSLALGPISHPPSDQSVTLRVTNRSPPPHLEERAQEDLEIQLDPPGVKRRARTNSDQVLDQLTRQRRRITDDETDENDGMVLALAETPSRVATSPGVGNVHRRRHPSSPRQRGKG